MFSVLPLDVGSKTLYNAYGVDHMPRAQAACAHGQLYDLYRRST